MSKARELAELSRTVSDSADAVAITINASEDVTFANDITVTGNTTTTGLTVDTTTLIVDSTNNRVGVGTGTPASLLDATGAPLATSGALVRVRNSSATASNTSFGGVLFTSSPGTDFSIGKSNVNAATSLSFRNGNTGANLMELDHSGNLLVGTTSTIPFLSSSATGAGFTSTGTLMAAASAEAGLFNRIGSNGTIVDFRKSGTVKGRIGTDGSDIFIGSDDTNLLFQSGGVLPANSVGGVRDNAFALGSSSARYTDLYLSGGVNFSANANASGMSSELFSDYEIGTWTPTVAGVTISVGRANYTKVGRAVVLDFNFVITSTSHTGDSFIISGIPFTASSANSETMGSLMIRYADFSSSTTQANLYHYSREPVIYIYLSRDNGNWGTLSRNDFTSSSAAIIGTITIVVD